LIGGFKAAHKRLAEELAEDARRTASWTGRGEFSGPVMRAMMEVPRHQFVTAGEAPFAYANRPLSIGHGQTISQPFIVALMTELLDLEPGDKVLEVGTGSGYQTAVLAALAGDVYTIEIIPELADAARRRLAHLGYRNIIMKIAQGREGWPGEAPFDAIMVTAAAPVVPPALVDQLAPGGRMVVPVGEHGGHQDLVRIFKSADGRVEEKNVLAVAFVPLVED
jgi:protein-L-isoaspartate(D-aspartate) O-methyltransferase